MLATALASVIEKITSMSLAFGTAGSHDDMKYVCCYKLMVTLSATYIQGSGEAGFLAGQYRQF